MALQPRVPSQREQAMASGPKDLKVIPTHPHLRIASLPLEIIPVLLLLLRPVRPAVRAGAKAWCGVRPCEPRQRSQTDTEEGPASSPWCCQVAGLRGAMHSAPWLSNAGCLSDREPGSQFDNFLHACLPQAGNRKQT